MYKNNVYMRSILPNFEYFSEGSFNTKNLTWIYWFGRDLDLATYSREVTRFSIERIASKPSITSQNLGNLSKSSRTKLSSPPIYGKLSSLSSTTATNPQSID